MRKTSIQILGFWGLSGSEGIGESPCGASNNQEEA